METQLNRPPYQKNYFDKAFIMLILLCLFRISTACAGENEIKIGVIYPLSGVHKETGMNLKAAVDFAAKIINETSTLDFPFASTSGLPHHGGAKIKVIYADHQGDVQNGEKLITQLISDPGVVALMGCYHSAVTAKASEVAEREKIPFLSATSTSSALTRRGFKWFFCSTPHDGLFAENFFQFLNDLNKFHGLGINRLAILNENTLWGTGVANAELALAQKYKYNIVSTIQYPQDSSLLTNEVKLLNLSQPQVLFQASYLLDAVLAVHTFKEQRFAPQAIIGMNAGFISPGFIEQLKGDAENLLSREVWSDDLRLARPLIGSVADLYTQTTGKTLNGNSARAFTGLMVLADAINRATLPQPDQIRASLNATDIPERQIIMPWKGIRFDRDTHQNVLGRGIIVQIQQKKYVTVWPFDLASRPIVWPHPGW